MRCHPSSFTHFLLVVALLPGVVLGQRIQTAPPAFATAVFGSDSISPSWPATSPDGRWIVFSGTGSLWIVPARGGAPRRMTSSLNDGWGAVWFPSSDRIAYIALPGGIVMTQAIDPGTGKAKGAPQRVTLDEATGLDLSPDGSLIVYSTRRWADAKTRLKVVPARGGPARVIHSAVYFRPPPRFAPDGRSVFATVISGDRAPNQLLRVPVHGGAAKVVLEMPWSSGPMRWVSANVALLQGPDRLSAVTLSGDTLWSIPDPPGSMSAMRLSPDGKSALLPTHQSRGADIHLVPTDGGTPRNLTTGVAHDSPIEGVPYDYPAGWSADGRRIYIETERQKKKGILVVDVDGHPGEFIPLPTDSNRIGFPRIIADGRIWVWPQRSAADRYLSLYDTKTRTQSILPRSAGLKRINGPGGYDVGVPELYYLDRGANGLELRKLGGDGQLRTVRRLSFDVPPTAKVSFANDRLVYWVPAGDSAVRYVADADRVPKRVYALRGSVGESPLSFDGRSLAVSTLSGPARGSALTHVMMLGLTPSGDLAGEPRSIQTSMVWDLRWLPDNRSLLALEMQEDGSVTRVMKFSMDAARPVNVTAGEPGKFWNQYPSPDGVWTAIAVEKGSRGGTIWRVDLEAAARAWRARARK